MLALLATGGSVTVMLIARKEGEEEPIRQRIKEYKNKSYELDFAAAESAYLMAQTQQRYKKLKQAGEVAFEGEIQTAYLESLGINPQEQPALTGTVTLDTTTNPGDKVEQQANTRGDQTRTGRRVQNAYPHQLPQRANLWRPRQWKNYLC